MLEVGRVEIRTQGCRVKNSNAAQVLCRTLGRISKILNIFAFTIFLNFGGSKFCSEIFIGIFKNLHQTVLWLFVWKHKMDEGSNPGQERFISIDTIKAGIKHSSVLI